MKYFRRYAPDGSCVIICLRCFATIGAAGNLPEAQGLESLHECPWRAVAGQPQSSPVSCNRSESRSRDSSGRILDFAARVPNSHTGLLILAVLLILYGLPTIVELVAVHRAFPAMGLIAFGDLLGCVCLSTLLEMPALGVTLYLALLLVEIGIDAMGALPRPALPWILDLVPTLVVIRKSALLRGKYREEQYFRELA